MSATSIFFNGRLISVPGAYTEIDASALEAVGLGASGYVGLIGTAVGGKPYSAIEMSDVRGTMQVATRPTQPFQFFRSGNLKEAAPLVFGPSTDPDIPSGAQAIYFVKANPAAAASASFPNTDGAALNLTAADYGYFTNQINVEIGNGTLKGKLLTITFEATEEVFDDVGGDVMFKLKYLSTAPATGFTTITGQVTAAEVKTLFTRANVGIDGDVTNQATAGEKIELISSDAGDTAVVIEIIGTNGSNAAQRELVTLNGLTLVQTVATWNSFHGARVYSGTLAGTCTIRRIGAGLTITTLTVGAPKKGLATCTDMAVAGTVLTCVAGGASTKRLTILGLSATGTVQVETFLLSGTTPVVGTALWKRIDYLALGEVAAATTVTVSGTSVSAPFAGFDTMQKLADKYNGTAGYTFTLVTALTALDPSNLDIVSAASILSPAEVSYYANLWAIITKLNSESTLVTAARGTPGTGAPTNTTAPVYLAGGHEGSATPGQEAVPTASHSDWQACLDLLKLVRVNSVVVLTPDPSVHADLEAHCAYMCGVGRSERDGFVGLMNAGMTDVASKTELKAQIVNLNSRHIRAWAQAVERYDTAGDQVEFEPHFGAAILAGMQAGSPVATSLTHKYMNVLKLRGDSSWNPMDDAEELIQAGLVFGEVVDGIGRRVVRNVTTHLTTSNIAYTEGSVNEAVNYAVYNFRTQMERMVGKTGFMGSVNAAAGIAINTLGLMIGVCLVTWRSLDIQLVLDVLEVGVEIAPVLPINFAEMRIHLVSVPQSAAAAA